MNTGKNINLCWRNLSSASLFAIASLWCQSTLALTLQQAQDIAMQSDPLVASHLATARALDNESTASATLPDPKLRLGMFNVPLDSFELDQNPTTQLRLGLQQQFPRGDVLDIKAEQANIRSHAAQARAEDARRRILRDLREAFLNVYYESEAARIISDNKSLFSKLVKITEDQYAAGRVNQQDVIHADLELSRLHDRHSEILGKADQYRAVLSSWIGDAAWQSLDKGFPALPQPQLGDINSVVSQHPAILALSAEVDAARKMSEIARQDYSPGFNAFVEYRARFGDNPDGSERADMMAAMVTMDIPLFTENRQDKNVTASEERTNAARFRLDDKIRSLKQMFDSNRVMYERAVQRESLYRKSLLSSAKNNAKASLNAYQSGVSEFTTLMRAQITELDVRLDDLRVRVDKAIAQAHLLYVTGE